ncbi:hypothetical protein P3L10_021600 [Capsicum annuum]
MISGQSVYLPILLFIYLHVFSSRFIVSQPFGYYNASPLNSTTGLSNSWTNMLSELTILEPILQSINSLFIFGFYYPINNSTTECLLDYTDPPQYYIVSNRYDTQDRRFYYFDGRTFTALQDPYTSETQFIKLDPDGHLRIYQLDAFAWKQLNESLVPGFENCGYPVVCGKYSICTNNGQCNCTVEGNFFSPIKRNPNLGCSQLTSISCNSSQYHSLIELKETTYFAFETNYKPCSSIWFEGTKMEDCKFACLSNCSCKDAVWSGTLRKNCLLLNGVFSLMDNWSGSDKTKVFLKVQNLVKAQYQKLSGKAGDLLDLAPILPGTLTRFSYNELKIITQDFRRKLGEGGFGSVYEGTLSNGNKIAVKHLNGVGQVKDSFLTEVKIVGSIHHINLVKLIGFCAEKDHRVLIYEYMVNGSLDGWISQEKQENGLTWITRKLIISDIGKGLTYLHDECSQKIIHLDIKPHNILLDQNFNAKISDFGLSKLIEKDKSKVMTRMRGTPGYLDPEWLRSVITEKVDVYAFGIVLLDLDWSQADEDNVHLLSVFTRKAEYG